MTGNACQKQQPPSSPMAPRTRWVTPGDCPDPDMDVKIAHIMGGLDGIVELPNWYRRTRAHPPRDVPSSGASDVRSSTFNAPGGDIVGSHRSAAAPDIGSSDVININISIDDGLLACTTSSAINSHKPGESYGFPHRALLLSGPPSSDGENYRLGLDNSSGSRRSSRDMETPFGLSNSNNVPRHQYHCPGCNCIDRTSFRGGNDTEYYPPISPRPVDSSIALPGQREPPSDREVFLWDEILRADKF